MLALLRPRSVRLAVATDWGTRLNLDAGSIRQRQRGVSPRCLRYHNRVKAPRASISARLPSYSPAIRKRYSDLCEARSGGQICGDGSVDHNCSLITRSCPSAVRRQSNMMPSKGRQRLQEVFLSQLIKNATPVTVSSAQRREARRHGLLVRRFLHLAGARGRAAIYKQEISIISTSSPISLQGMPDEAPERPAADEVRHPGAGRGRTAAASASWADEQRMSREVGTGSRQATCVTQRAAIFTRYSPADRVAPCHSGTVFGPR